MKRVGIYPASHCQSPIKAAIRSCVFHVYTHDLAMCLSLPSRGITHTIDDTGPWDRLKCTPLEGPHDTISGFGMSGLPDMVPSLGHLACLLLLTQRQMA